MLLVVANFNPGHENVRSVLVISKTISSRNSDYAMSPCSYMGCHLLLASIFKFNPFVFGIGY